MRKIIGAVFVSLDGVMQAPGGPEEDCSGGFELGGWIWAYSDDVTREAVRGYLLGAPYALLLGRILLEAEPYDQEALRLTCLALRKSENHRSLARLYQQARGNFLQVGEVLPTDWAVFLDSKLAPPA